METYLLFFRLEEQSYKLDGTNLRKVGAAKGDLICVRGPGDPGYPNPTDDEKRELMIRTATLTPEQVAELRAQIGRHRAEPHPVEGLNFTYETMKDGRMEKRINREADKTNAREYFARWDGFSKYGMHFDIDSLSNQKKKALFDFRVEVEPWPVDVRDLKTKPNEPTVKELEDVRLLRFR
jgi:hypothetical protein